MYFLDCCKSVALKYNYCPLDWRAGHTHYGQAKRGYVIRAKTFLKRKTVKSIGGNLELKLGAKRDGARLTSLAGLKQLLSNCSTARELQDSSLRHVLLTFSFPGRSNGTWNRHSWLTSKKYASDALDHIDPNPTILPEIISEIHREPTELENLECSTNQPS